MEETMALLIDEYDMMPREVHAAMKHDDEKHRDLLLPWIWALGAICGLSLAAWAALWLIVVLIRHVLRVIGVV
jgi:hypothetical protein